MKFTTNTVLGAAWRTEWEKTPETQNGPARGGPARQTILDASYASRTFLATATPIATRTKRISSFFTMRMSSLIVFVPGGASWNRTSDLRVISSAL